MTSSFAFCLIRIGAKRSSLPARASGHLDLPRMRAAGFAGGFFAIYLPSPTAHDDADYQAQMANPPYALPLPDLIPFAKAIGPATAAAGHLLWMERASAGALKVCRSASEVQACLADGTVAAIMHMEGAEALDERLDALHLSMRSACVRWDRSGRVRRSSAMACPSPILQAPTPGRG